MKNGKSTWSDSFPSIHSYGKCDNFWANIEFSINGLNSNKGNITPYQKPTMIRIIDVFCVTQIYTIYIYLYSLRNYSLFTVRTLPHYGLLQVYFINKPQRLKSILLR